MKQYDKKVLSIDFDYFQKVSAETMRKCYPDGIDLSTEISTLVWGSHYSNPHTKVLLNEVGILEDEFRSMTDILLNQDSRIPVMIANSHVNIYDFIHDNVSETEKMFLVNVDMHHDMFNDNQGVDCGNWLGYINREYGNCSVWIANPVSADMYGLTDNDLPEDSRKKKLGELIPTSTEAIRDEQFDLIFLCRSDIWLPPHLDEYFSEMCETIRGHFQEVIIEQGIDKPRDYLPYAKQAEQFYQR